METRSKRGGARPGTGGARPGAGRKPMDISEKEKASVLKAARLAAKKYGSTPWEILFRIMHNDLDQTDVTVREQLAAIKIFRECVIATTSHNVNEETPPCAPVVLPMMADDPAKLDMNATPLMRGEALQ
ncbi:MAG: hypothetical protein HZB55_18615 [Deltaproteobacteria bacterium]|nr:hypothetical protein [Deltaproteobacteria bacterium]